MLKIGPNRDELDAALASDGGWVDCDREEPTAPKPR